MPNRLTLTQDVPCSIAARGSTIGVARARVIVAKKRTKVGLMNIVGFKRASVPHVPTSFIYYLSGEIKEK